MIQYKMTKSKVDDAFEHIDTIKILSPRDVNCIRLLIEEMFSLCNELLDAKVLDFELSYNEEKVTIRVSTKTRMNEDARTHLMSMSTTGKNEANKGVKGMLGWVLEVLSYNGHLSVNSSAMLNNGMFLMGEQDAYYWSLMQYMANETDDVKKQNWDGMEKSIIANFSDDVVIGVRGNRLEMTVTKTF